jgi:hypothetical protein
MSILGTRMARAYSLGCAPDGSLTVSTGSSSSSSDGSLSTFSTDGDDLTVPSLAAAAAAVAAPAAAAAAAAVEDLLSYAARQLALVEAAQTAQPASSSSFQHAGQQQQQGASRDCSSLLKLLQVSATLSRNCARASSSSSNSGDTPVSFTDSLTTLSAATAVAAEAGSSRRRRAPAAAFLDTLVHKLHPLCAAVAPTCTPQQLLALMTAWNQLGFSTAWRFGGLRQGYKRLGQQQLLRWLSGAELAVAVEAVAQLPPTKSVVEALAGEVLRRQELLQAVHAVQDDGWATEQAVQAAGVPSLSSTAGTPSKPTAEAAGVSGAACEPLSPAQLLAVVCAVPKLKPYWPTEVTLLLLTHIKGHVLDTMTPTQQWRLWNTLQQLQQQWKPSAVAAAAAAAAAVDCTSSSRRSSATRGEAGQSSSSRVATAEGDQMHPAVTFAAAAAAASLKGTPAPSDPPQSPVTPSGLKPDSSKAPAATSDSAVHGKSVPLVRPERPVAPLGCSAASSVINGSSSHIELHGRTSQQQQQQVMRLLDELQGLVASALSKVQPDPDALPLEAAPPRLTKHPSAGSAASISSSSSHTHTAAGARSYPAAAGGQRYADAEQGQRSQQQVLAAFAKVQKSLLSPHCTEPVMVKVLEGLLLLLAVPRYAKAGACGACDTKQPVQAASSPSQRC